MTAIHVGSQTDFISLNPQTHVSRKETFTTEKVSRVFSIVAEALRSVALGCVGFAFLGNFVPLNSTAFLTAGAVSFITAAGFDTVGQLLRLHRV